MHLKKKQIITGAGARVNIPAKNKVLLALEDQTAMPYGMFFETFRPKVKVTNEFDTEVTQFDIIVIANGHKYVKTFSGTLGKDESTLVDFGELDADFTGNYYIKIYGFENINNSDNTGNLIIDLSNEDNFSAHKGIHLNRKAFSKAEFTFEEEVENCALDMSENDNFRVVQYPYQKIGANDSKGAVTFTLLKSREVEGKEATLLFGEAELSILADATLSYYYAYSDGTFGGTAPTIMVAASEDDGLNWQEIKMISALETNIGSSEKSFVPTTDEYIKETVSLKDYFGKDILLKLSVIPGTDGNALWIDQVEIDGVYDNVGIITTDTEQLNFGLVSIGSSSEKSISIINSGSADLNISSISLIDEEGVFEMLNANDLTSIQAGESTDLQIRCTPLTDDLYVSTVKIKSNDPTNPVISLYLVGEGEGNSVASEFIANSSLKIMPNPVETSANLVYSYAGTNAVSVDYTLVDVIGKTVLNIGSAWITKGQNSLKFDVSNLSVGKYFLVITANNIAVQQVPLIIEK